MTPNEYYSQLKSAPMEVSYWELGMDKIVTKIVPPFEYKEGTEFCDYNGKITCHIKDGKLLEGPKAPSSP